MNNQTFIFICKWLGADPQVVLQELQLRGYNISFTEGADISKTQLETFIENYI